MKKIDDLNSVRKAINDCFGGMGRSSALWSNATYDKGWTAGVLAALTAFDTAIKTLNGSTSQGERNDN